jgi:O-antigen ligase
VAAATAVVVLCLLVVVIATAPVAGVVIAAGAAAVVAACARLGVPVLDALRGAAAAAVLFAAALIVALRPAFGLLVAAVAAAGALLWPVRRHLPAAAGAAVVVLVLLALAAFAPGIVLVVGALPLAAGAIWVAGPAAVVLVASQRERVLRIGRAVALPAAPFVVLALGVGLALWPVTTGLALVVGGVVALAWLAPGWALAAGVLLIGFEGSIKILLELEPTPLPFAARTVGAAAIDLALFSAIAGVLVADRLETPRAILRATTRAERIALGLLVAWFALSILQIAQGGDIARGVDGFRLFQSYVVVALAAAVLFARQRVPGRLLTVALGVAGCMALYAAIRVAIGAAEAEQLYALRIASTTIYGDQMRAIGSFSSSVGMVSFLTPVVVVGLVAGYLLPRLRVLGFAVSALALVAVIASFGRGALFGILAGLLFALVVVVASSGVTIRGKMAAALMVVFALGTTYGIFIVASRDSDALRERAQGVLRPGEDKSVNIRLETWRETLDGVAAKPLGHGIGTVGAASGSRADERKGVRTADNAFLKVLYEQGVQGALLFVAGLLATLFLLARRLAHAPRERRAAGIAALAGFTGFLVLSTTGEYVEQPGKVAAWALLGIAIAAALAPARREEERA